MKKTSKMAFANIVTALVFAAIGVYAIVASGKIRVVNNAAVQPSTFPRVMAVMMIICAAVVCVMNVLKLSTDTEEAPIISPRDRGIRGVLYCLALAVVYTFLWESVGFLILAPIAMFALMWLIRMRNYKVMVIVSIVLPLVVWLLFYKALAISIPIGPLTVIYDFF